MSSEKPEINQEPKIPEFTFRPEGYVNINDGEFLEQFSRYLSAQGLQPDQLLFSGTSAQVIYDENGQLRKPQGIFAMNLAGWQESIRQQVETPAGYAEDKDEPLIVILKADQCAEVYHHDMGEASADSSELVNAKVIKIGDSLAEHPDKVVTEMVANPDINKSVMDACMAVVRLDLQ